MLKAAKKPLKAKTSLRKKTIQPKLKKPRKYVPLAKKSITALVTEVDKVFSRYVRIRDSERVGNSWYGKCITCSKTGIVAYIDDDGKLRFTKGWDNGHFVGRGNWITRFEEENNNLQCSMRCNKMRSGEYVKYKAALRDKYGDGVAEKLEKMADEQPARTYRFKREELLQIYKDSVEQVKFYVEYEKVLDN